MSIKNIKPAYFLGQPDLTNPKVLGSKVAEMIDAINTNAMQSNHIASAVPATTTITSQALSQGYITSTSAAAVAITLPTATDLATFLNAQAGTSFEFIVDNTAGANTVTIVVNTGITAATPVITGGATLTVSVANAIGIFRIVFSSATVAKLFRIA